MSDKSVNRDGVDFQRGRFALGSRGLFLQRRRSFVAPRFFVNFIYGVMA